MAQANPMASVLVVMPLGADEPKASSNLRFCSVRWMSLHFSHGDTETRSLGCVDFLQPLTLEWGSFGRLALMVGCMTIYGFVILLLITFSLWIPITFSLPNLARRAL